MPPKPAPFNNKELIIMPSPRMSQLGEHGFIRMTKETRKNQNIDPTDFESNVFNLEGQSESYVSQPLVLTPQKIYKEDLAGLFKHPEFKHLSGHIAFVSETIFNKLIEEEEEQHDITTEEIDVVLGTDPEFALRKEGAPHAIEAKKILDASTKLKRFGEDGPCAEVRPIPSTDVNELVKNTENAFKQGLETKAIDYDWIGGILTLGEPDGRWFQLGGHVHIGHPLTSTGLNFTRFTPLLMRVLDEFLSIPLARVEGEDGFKRRTLSYHNQIYGNWGDFRTKPKNSPIPKRFEWRTASGVWTLSPSFYMATLHIVKKISDSFYRMLNTMSRNSDGDIDDNSIFRFHDYINRRICAVHLNSEEEYKELLRTVGHNFESVKEQVELAENALKSSIDLFGMDKSIVEMFLDFCKSSVDEINKTRSLKIKWIAKEPEHVVGKNMLNSLTVVSKPVAKPYKIVSVHSSH